MHKEAARYASQPALNVQGGGMQPNRFSHSMPFGLGMLNPQQAQPNPVTQLQAQPGAMATPQGVMQAAQKQAMHLNDGASGSENVPVQRRKQSATVGIGCPGHALGRLYRPEGRRKQAASVVASEAQFAGALPAWFTFSSDSPDRFNLPGGISEKRAMGAFASQPPPPGPTQIPGTPGAVPMDPPAVMLPPPQDPNAGAAAQPSATSAAPGAAPQTQMQMPATGGPPGAPGQSPTGPTAPMQDAPPPPLPMNPRMMPPRAWAPSDMQGQQTFGGLMDQKLNAEVPTQMSGESDMASQLMAAGAKEARDLKNTFEKFAMPVQRLNQLQHYGAAVETTATESRSATGSWSKVAGIAGNVLSGLRNAGAAAARTLQPSGGGVHGQLAAVEGGLQRWLGAGANRAEHQYPAFNALQSLRRVTGGTPTAMALSPMQKQLQAVEGGFRHWRAQNPGADMNTYPGMEALQALRARTANPMISPDVATRAYTPAAMQQAAPKQSADWFFKTGAADDYCNQMTVLDAGAAANSSATGGTTTLSSTSHAGAAAETTATSQMTRKHAEDSDTPVVFGNTRMRGWQWRALQNERNDTQQNWLPRIFQSDSTPLTELLASPAKQGVLKGLLGAGLGAGAGYLAGTQLNTGVDPALLAAGGGLAGGMLGGVHGYGSRRRENDRVFDALRRSPPGATVHDYRALQDQDAKQGMDKAALNVSGLRSQISRLFFQPNGPAAGRAAGGVGEEVMSQLNQLRRTWPRAAPEGFSAGRLLTTATRPLGTAVGFTGLAAGGGALAHVLGSGSSNTGAAVPPPATPQSPQSPQSPLTKSSAQRHDGRINPQRSATGESEGLSYQAKPDQYMQGQDAWASVGAYFKGKSKRKEEPNPFEGRHSAKTASYTGAAGEQLQPSVNVIATMSDVFFARCKLAGLSDEQINTGIDKLAADFPEAATELRAAMEKRAWPGQGMIRGIGTQIAEHAGPAMNWMGRQFGRAARPAAQAVEHNPSSLLGRPGPSLAPHVPSGPPPSAAIPHVPTPPPASMVTAPSAGGGAAPGFIRRNLGQALPVALNAAGGGLAAGDISDNNPWAIGAGMAAGGALGTRGARNWMMRNPGNPLSTALHSAHGGIAGELGGSALDWTAHNLGYEGTNFGRYAGMAGMGIGAGRGIANRNVAVHGAAGAPISNRISQWAGRPFNAAQQFGSGAFEGTLNPLLYAGRAARNAISGGGGAAQRMFNPTGGGIPGWARTAGRYTGLAGLGGGAVLGAHNMAQDYARNTTMDSLSNAYQQFSPQIGQDVTNFMQQHGMAGENGQFNPLGNIGQHVGSAMHGLSGGVDHIFRSIGMDPSRMSPLQKMMILGGLGVGGAGAVAGSPVVAGAGGMAGLAGLLPALMAQHRGQGMPQGQAPEQQQQGRAPALGLPPGTPQARNEWEVQQRFNPQNQPR